jgi:hypothetical protein
MTRLLQLAQELDWQTLELLRAGVDPPAGARSPEPLEERQRGLIATADKIQRELLATVRFDPARLVGVGGPIDATFDALAGLLVAIDEVRHDALVVDARRLASAVGSFQRLLQGFCEDRAPVAA